VHTKRTGSEERHTAGSNVPAPSSTTPAPNTASSPDRSSAPVEVAATAVAAAAAAAAVAQNERERASEREPQQPQQQEGEAERERERPRSSWAAPTPTEERPPFQPTAYPDVQGSPNKRKRSNSPPASHDGPRDHFGRRGEAEPRDGNRAGSRDRNSSSPPKSNSFHDADLRRALARDRGREFERGGSRLRFALVSVKDDNWGPNYEQAHSAVPDSAVSEVDPNGDLVSGERMDSAGYDEQQSPDMDVDDSPVASFRHGSFIGEQRRDGLIQSDPKKRKRNFSNRTKTGCLTCRRRKKKCDEAKPECK
jgi:hypothetical protein